MARRFALSLTALTLIAGAALAAASDLTPEQINDSVLGAMDRTADPCQDFYRYSCGNWIDKTKMPSDQTRWVRSFSVVTESNRDFLHELLEDAAKNPGKDADRQRFGDFYASCMDETALEEAGVKPLAGYLAKIDKVADGHQAFLLAAQFQRGGGNPFFNMRVAADAKNPTLNILQVGQGGLGMPDRDYYVSTDPKKQALLVGYEQHVARMLGLIGETPDAAAAHAKAIVGFETELAKVARERAALRDANKTYNKLDRHGLAGLAKLDWDGFFAAAGYPKIEQINVRTPEFFPVLEQQLSKASPDTLKAYLRWNLVNGFSDALPKAFVDAHYDFYGKQLAGQQELAVRWKRCVDATQRALGESVGKAYVDAKFPGDSKKVALEMIGDIETAFADDLPTLSWMDAETQKRALEKKAAVANQIGYPDKWRDYSAMKIARGSYFDNAVASGAFDAKRELDKVGKPVDKLEWPWPPQTVNASYSPAQNRINFPAGILQPPFFNHSFPAALNYGAIGTVIGHELTHGFDDEGRKFDPQGNLREWWSKGATEKFEKVAQCVDDQYSRFEIEPGIHVNGKLTLGENIADNGGLKESWLAFKAYQKRHGNDGGTVPGLLPDQLFFVAHGQVWCGLVSAEQARLRVTTDPHSPSQFRVYGPIANHPNFAETFQCKPGTPMNPVDKCVVW
ncbi:MAG: M13 family metallopeptidase [Acidobacteriota bacterium]